MSDALPLPPRPNLEQYKKLAKDFQHACKSSDQNALRDWIRQWATSIARLQGTEITPEVATRISSQAEQMERRWLRILQSDPGINKCTLSAAQLFVAHGHGFASWPKFTKHLEALARADSTVSHFESAVDAIIEGDTPSLAYLLRERPDLVRQRSLREHRSSLLHYVSANGVEDFRQKTPRNIVDIAKLLLESGADVNAESDAYGGHSTALVLTATSVHPEKAGVQIPLLELLIEHGALIDAPDGSSAINSCLRNGRGHAAEFLANRGARLDLEGAAGVGRLDLVNNFLNEDGSLPPTATNEQLNSGFAWACEFGRTDVVEYLLDQGFDVGAQNVPHGQTGLHWAALGGQVDTVKLLLDRHAPVNVIDKTYGGTPLGWSLHAWLGEAGTVNDDRYYPIVSHLVKAGANIEPEWLTNPKIHSDPKMLAALKGQAHGE